MPGLGPGPAVPLLLQQAAPSVSGTAPALRGGASSGTAPALRGGASLAEGAFAFDLLRTSLALLAVCLCAFMTLRFLSRRGFGGLLSGGAPGTGALRVVQRLPLEPRKTLYLVALGRRRLLIATGESGAPRLIAELDPEAMDATEAPTPEAPGGRDA